MSLCWPLLSSLPLPVLAAGGASPLVEELGICLLAAGFLSALFARMKIPTIAALLGAGVIVGPLGFQLVDSPDDIETIANLGLSLLLFVIGIEINPRALLSSGRTLLLTGAFQVPATVLVAFGVFSALAAAFPTLLSDTYAIGYAALACAFSSTLLVVRFLQERRWLDTVSGRLAVGLLIFQDVWAIVVLALQPSFESPELLPIVLTFLGIAIVVTLAVLGARFVLPHVFAAVSTMPDLVVSVALAWCFLVGLGGQHLGTLTRALGLTVELSVSMEMGALIAGMTIASYPYHHEVAAKVSNLRDFFVTLFFVALGMSIPLPSQPAVIGLALALACVAIVLRAFVFFPMFHFTGLDRDNSLSASMKLAQISEFSLVITYLGARNGHVSDAFASTVVLAFVVTALATPTFFSHARTLPARLGPLLEKLGVRPPGEASSEGEHGARTRIVLLGFHRVAHALLQDIGRRHPDWLPEVLVIDTNVKTHATIRELGARVMYGDIGDLEVLRHAHVEQAEIVISTVPDELLTRTSNEAVVRALRTLTSTSRVFACAERGEKAVRLYAAGASYVFMPPVETANGVMEAVTAALSGQLDAFRATREASCGAPEEHKDIAGMAI